MRVEGRVTHFPQVSHQVWWRHNTNIFFFHKSSKTCLRCIQDVMTTCPNTFAHAVWMRRGCWDGCPLTCPNIIFAHTKRGFITGCPSTCFVPHLVHTSTFFCPYCICVEESHRITPPITHQPPNKHRPSGEHKPEIKWETPPRHPKNWFSCFVKGDAYNLLDSPKYHSDMQNVYW